MRVRYVEVPVLIVGGGPTGLAAALSLSDCGVASLLVDKHPSTSHHPKATVVNARTMELLRQWGAADLVERAGIPARDLRCVSWSTSLGGFEIGRLPIELSEQQIRDARLSSPTLPVMCPQDVLEPILRSAAETQPATSIRYGQALWSFRQDDHGVTATVVDRASGEETKVRAEYMVGCDGRDSTVRRIAGVGLSGAEPLGDMRNIYFRADLTHLVAHRMSPLYWIVNPDTPGVIITLNGTDRWLLNVPLDMQAGERIDDHPPERCLAQVRRAIGDAGVDVELLGVHGWQMTRLVADRFRHGRVLLAGDAAHQFPPTGGHGMNSGIQDAHNLAWKLSAVLDGWAGPGLLDSYEAERRPIAQLLTSASVGNAAAMRGQLRPPPEIEHDTDEGQAIRDFVAEAATGQRGHFVSTGLALGVGYRSSAVLTDPEDDVGGEVDEVEHYRPNAAAGHRAPHIWLLSPGGEAGRSSLDLFRDTLVLLTGPEGDGWVAAARHVATSLAVPLRAYVIGRGGAVDELDVDGRFPDQYGLDPMGAVLVRPDGHVLWRAKHGSDDPAGVLEKVLCEGLDR